MKKAVLIGNNYTGTQCELRGCINDVTYIRDLLVSKHGFSLNNIVLLKEATKQQTLQHMAWLVSGAKKGDTLLWYYSGHGTQCRDTNGDELDRFDECIYTVDNQLVLDDDFHREVVAKTNGSKLMMFFDCCHSGTMCDLGHNMRYEGKDIYYWSQPSKEINDDVCVFSGCMDHQTSADSSFVKPEKANERVAMGAFTYYLLEALAKHNNKAMNFQVLNDMYNGLKAGGYEQTCQFSCSKPALFDAPFL